MKRPRTITLFLILYAGIAPAETPTKIIIFNAYTQENTLNHNLIVAQRYTGYCFTRSLSNPERPDAWRCMASNIILDPCFQDSTSLACVSNPWSHKVAVLELTQPINKVQKVKVNFSTAQPWGFELENGERCSFLTGASAVVDNQRVNYACQTYKYSILGTVDRSTSVWKVNLYNFENKTLTTVPVKIAWF